MIYFAIAFLILFAFAFPAMAQSRCEPDVDVETYFARAETAFAELDYEGAVADFTCVLALNGDPAAPESMTSLIHRMFAYRELGYYDAAIADLDRILK